MIVLSVLLGVSVLAGCGGGGEGDGYIADVYISEDYTGELKVNYIPGDVGEFVILEKLTDAFRAKYPNITVKLQTLTGNDYFKTISSMAAAGTLGDVFLCQDEYLTMTAKRNYLDDLTPYLAQEKLNFDASLYNDNMMAQSKVDGKQYMLPRDHSQVVIVVNLTMFDAAKAWLFAQDGTEIELPGDDWTMDDFYEIAGKVQPYLNANKPNGLQRYAACLGTLWTPVVNTVVKAKGGKIIENNKLAIDNDTQAAYQEIKRFADAGYAHKIDDVSFTLGEVMFAISTRTHFSKCDDMKSGGQKVDFDYLPFPQIGDGSKDYIPSGAVGYGMFSRSKHKREAMAYLRFMMSEEGQKALCASGNIVPTMKSFYTDETLKAHWQMKKTGGTEYYNNGAFIYNVEKTHLSDLTASVVQYDKNVDILNGIIGFFRSYNLGEKTWATGLSDLEKSIGSYLG